MNQGENKERKRVKLTPELRSHYAVAVHSLRKGDANGCLLILFQRLQSSDGHKHSNCHSFLPMSKKMHFTRFISSHYLFTTHPLLHYCNVPLFVSLYDVASQCPHPYFPATTFSFSVVSHLCNGTSLNTLLTLLFTDDCVLGCFTLYLELLPPLKHKNEGDKGIYFLTDISSTSETFLKREGVYEPEIDHKMQLPVVFLLFVAFILYTLENYMWLFVLI